MKKAKILMSTLTVATLAIGCGAFVACGNKEPAPPAGESYEITFDANGGSYAEGAETVKLNTDENGRLEAAPTAVPTISGYSFAYYNTAEDGSGDTITYGVSGYKFTSATTVYAQYVAAGVYKTDGTFLAELEEVDAGDFDRQFTAYVELDAGDVIILKVDGITLGTTEKPLWPDGGNHGIDFNATAGTLTAGGTYGYTIYAKDGYGGWTIYMDDGVKDEGELVLNGSYLCGQGWTNANWDKAISTNYIDPENGLTVTFSEGAEFKLATCTDVDNATREWSYQSASYYKMADGKEEGYLDLSAVATGNGKVITPGEYKITIEGEGDNVIFVFTPADGLEPSTDYKFVDGGFYLAGAGFSNASYSLVKELYLDPDGNGLEIAFTASNKIELIRSLKDVAKWEYGNNSYFKVAVPAEQEGKEEDYISFSSGKGTVQTAGTYIVTIEITDDIPLVIFTPKDGFAPAEPVEKFTHYYIRGSMYSSDWSTPVNAAHELTAVDGEEGVYAMTITLEADVVFGFFSDAEDADGKVIENQVDWFGTDLTLTGDGASAVTKDGNLKAVSAGTYTFKLNPTAKTLEVEFVAATPETPAE